MAKFDVLDMNGKKVSTIELSDAVFGMTPNEKVMHAAVVNFLANQRQGTQSTKTRSEVSWRRQEAVAPEGHRPRPSGLYPLSAVDARRHCPGPQAPRLQLPPEQEGETPCNGERAEREGPGRRDGCD